MKYYVLLPNHEIAQVGLMDWAHSFEVLDRHVGATETELHLISTVFLGLDHNFLDKGPPIVFETMIFNKAGGEVDGITGECWRYSSWDDAEAGHKTAVRRVLKAEADAAAVVSGAIE